MTLEVFLERHARSIVTIALALVVAGLVATLSMPAALFPQVSFPRVVVDLTSGDRPADQTALIVTRPVEDAVRSVPGVREVRSATSRGSAQISIDFGWGRDMIATTLLVDAAIAQALPHLPSGSSYGVRRMDATVFPIIAYSLTSTSLSPSAVRDFARLQVVPLLASIPGLARVDLQGGGIDEVEVLADPQRLAAHGLGLLDLAAAIAASNALQAVGRVQDHDKLYLVISNSDIRELAELGDIVVRSDAAGIVRVRDVATVVNGSVPQWIRVSEDGRPAVLFNVYEQPDGNAMKIASEVRARLASLKIPAGVTLHNWYDQSELVLQSAATVRDAVLIGLALAAAVLLLFLRSGRVMLIALVSVPGTLAITVLLLEALGMSFNIMTLGGIAAAVGLVIDDTIVMVEHVARRAGAQGIGDARSTVLPAAREFMRPLLGSSLATLIVFLPLGYLGGVTGAFAKALSIAMAAALVVSFLMAALVVPLLARRIIDFERWHDPAAGKPGRLERWHTQALALVFDKPWLILVGVLPLLVVGYVAYTRVSSGFMPQVDEGGFVMDFWTKPGTSLIETEREIAQVETILRGYPEIETFSRRTGTGLGGDLGEPNHGDFFVRLRANHARATEVVMAEVLAQVGKRVPGVRVELAQLMEDLIGDLTAVPEPIEIKLYAASPAVLVPQAAAVAAAIGKIEGVVEIKDGVVLAGDGINLKVDPVRVAYEGTSAQEVTQQVEAALAGTIATQLPRTTQVVGVRVRIPDASTLSDVDLADLPVRAADGHLFPLRRVAQLTETSGEPEISRDDLQPMVAVTARIEDRGIGATIEDIQKKLAEPGLLRTGVRYELGGLYRQQHIAFVGLAEVFAAALVAEFVLLLGLYEAFWPPIIIIATSLLSTTAVFIALWLTGVELNITALMGMTMIIGIATEMAIFYVSEYAQLCESLERSEALREASRNRLRPITMTTLAAILTLLPLALALGAGSGIQQPLAIAIIAGLVIQYPLVLLAMPVLLGLTIERPGGITES
jgi:multidrug efflux pump subunit AcrB